MMPRVYICLTVFVLAGISCVGCHLGISSRKSLHTLPAQVTWETKREVPEALKEAVMSYWGMRLADDFKDSYRYEAPYIRYLYSERQYQNILRKGQPLIHVRVADVSSCGDNCYYMYLYLRWGGSLVHLGDIPLQERWILVKGKYWHVLETLPDIL